MGRGFFIPKKHFTACYIVQAFPSPVLLLYFLCSFLCRLKDSPRAVERGGVRDRMVIPATGPLLRCSQAGGKSVLPEQR